MTMLVKSFSDEYLEAASMLGVSADELRSADARASPLRWVAYGGEDVIGVVNGRRRPDGRVFVRFGMTPQPAIGPLAMAAARELQSIHAVARSTKAKDLFVAAGFMIELVDDEFEISFAKALRSLGRLRLPPRFALRPPHELAEAKLAALDTELRQDVPGTDGWMTTRTMWRDEINSAEYDPTGYLVAVDELSGDYAGLIRFWRNRDMPRLGLLAVARQHRGTLLASALLRAGLEGANEWGSDEFQTSTSPSNKGTYPALTRLGAEPISRRYQMRFKQRIS